MSVRASRFLTLKDWELQLSSQAEVLKAYRSKLWQLLGMHRAAKILELGCGTGIILQELAGLTAAKLCGIDVDTRKLRKAALKVPRAELRKAKAERLPFLDETFDLVYSHFFLFWAEEPVLALKEAARVTCKGGLVAALAEPDYTSGYEFPKEIGILEWYSKIFKEQGAHIDIGGRLKALFQEAGLQEIVAGGAPLPQLTVEEQAKHLKIQWKIREKLWKPYLSPAEIKRRKEMEAIYLENGTRVLYLPIYYAWGIKK
jgi:ubiquinone/menaquinone biosynthesis C-methylase UbiE